jgi:undecaprenyl pyrophosphate synthase
VCASAEIGTLAKEKDKKEKSRKSKKDAQLVLRLNKELRDEFVDACKDLDTSAAREIRRFIKRFLKRYESGDFDE